MRKLRCGVVLGLICLSFMVFVETGTAAPRNLLTEFKEALDEATGPNVEKIDELLKEGLSRTDAIASFVSKLLREEYLLSKYAGKSVEIMKSLSKVGARANFKFDALHPVLEDFCGTELHDAKIVIEGLSEIGINWSSDLWIGGCLKIFVRRGEYDKKNVDFLCEMLEYFAKKETLSRKYTTYVIDIFAGQISLNPPGDAVASVLRILKILGGVKDDEVVIKLDELKKANRNVPEVLVAYQKIEDSLPFP